jgi:phage terminase large subunit-like protein
LSPVPTQSKLDLAREALKRVPTASEALAVIKYKAKQHKENQFISYWEPTEPQVKALRAFSAGIKTFGVRGGNRSGKTELGAVIAVAWALGKKYFEGTALWEMVKDLPIPEPPNNIWVVALDFPTLRDVIWREKLRSGREHPGLLPRDPSIVRKTSDSEFQVFFSNGSVITGKSADSGREKFQGASVDLVWIDEEPEVEIFDECYQRTIDCGGKILLTLTPLADVASGVRSPWVHELNEEWKAGKTDVAFVSLSVLDNPYVPDEEKVKLLAKWKGHPEERARLYGEFIRRSGLVYTMWNRELHLIKPFQIPKDWFRVVSIDPAATGPTAAIWCAYDEKGNQYLYQEYKEADRIVSEHSKSILLRNRGETVDIWLIDPKWGSQRNAADHKENYRLYRESGIPVRLAEVDDSYGLNVSFEYLNATLTPGNRHPRTYVFEDLGKFQNEIENYVWDMFAKGEQKGLTKEKPRKRNDHLLNAWQYACSGRFKASKGRLVSDDEKRRLAGLNSYTSPMLQSLQITNQG